MRAARVLALLAIAVFAGLTCQAALGFWSGVGESGDGEGIAGATTVNQGATPTARVTGATNVIVSWGASTLSNGLPVSAYTVKRYNQETGALATIGSGCAGTLAGQTCTETGVPVGDWEYTVTPAFSAHWRGPESVKSGGANTGPGSMILSRTLFGGSVAPLPAVATGTVSGFLANEPISFSLNDGAPLSASPSHVGADGSASFSVTIPAGTADGPYSLIVDSTTTDASAGILVDNTPPAVSLGLEPAANAAGWNRTSSVEVSATVSDGNGSGVAFSKYTTDGSDPKTSPTAQLADGSPIALSQSSTVKFYVVDNAGNESAVKTQQVKIDTTVPYFTVETIEVEGGYYEEPGDVASGIPGLTYYRGAAAGSFRLRLTPLALGGSPAVAAGFSALDPNAIGFSFDSTSVITPAGGPFVSGLVSWVAGTTANGGGAVSLTNAAGSTFGASGVTHNDSTSPTGGSVEAVGLVGTGGRYSTSLSLNLQLAKGTDGGSGLADGSAPRDLPAQLLRASAPLTSSNGVANGTCGTYSAFTKVGGNDPAPGVENTVPTDNTCYLYHYLVSDHVGNVATYTSQDIKVQTSPAASLKPTTAVLTPVSGVSAQSVSGSTVFYNPAQLGSFNVDSSASAPYAGIAQMSFPAIAGFSGGGAVTSPVSGTLFRSTYSWSANGASPSPGTQALTATNNVGLSATNEAAFTIVKDESGPNGGLVEATGLVGTGGRYSTSLTVSLALARGADAGAGLAASGAQLLRASAPLTSASNGNGACGTFGTFTQVGTLDPTTPKSDVVPADRTCYRYQYVVPDKVGNKTIYTAADVKVDTVAPPAPTLTFSGLSNSSATGTAVFYRPGAGSGGFQVNATSADTTAGVVGYAFPTLPGGWTPGAGTGGAQTYSWSEANPTAPTGAQSVSATNNAGRSSASSFTVTPDSTAPTAGSLTYTNGYSTGSTVSVTLVKGIDTGGAGVNSTSGILEVSTATLAGGACGAFGGFSLASTNPASGVSIPVVTGTCYQFRYLISDNVGNQATFTSASVTKVDTVAPTNALSLEAAENASMTGSTVYYKGNVAGSFKVKDIVTDAASGPVSATFPLIATTGWVHNLETINTPAGGPYVSSAFSWTATPSIPTTKSVFATDAAGKASTNASLAFSNDIVAPISGSVTYLNGTAKTLSVAVTTADGTDSLSGVNAALDTLKRDETTLNTTTGVCAAFPGTFATTVTRVAGADTSVASGNCYQYRYFVSDKVGNQATWSSANVVKVDTTGPQVTAIVSQQSGGTAGNGKLEIGDKLILTFNQSLATASVPSSFSGATETSPGAGQNVTLAIPGLTKGSLDTGSSAYLAAASTTATFGGTVVLVNAGTATTVTLTINSLSGATTAASTGSLIFSPAATITEASGIPAFGSFTAVTTFKLF
jgi:Chitobiase/beta-hexosaminidase C-terminal domain